MSSLSVIHKRTLYVGGLDDGVTEELLRAAFIPFGEILAITFNVDQITSNGLDFNLMTIEKHRGFAFIEYETIDDANAAVDNMHNAELFGKVITCSTANPNTISAKGKPSKHKICETTLPYVSLG